MFGRTKKPHSLDHSCAVSFGEVVGTFGHPEKRKQEANIAIMDQGEHTHLLLGLSWNANECNVSITSKDGERQTRVLSKPDCLHIKCLGAQE